MIDNFSKYLWCIRLKNKHSQTITKEFSKILTTSRRSPFKKESDRGKERYKPIFQNFLKRKYSQHYLRFKAKGPSIAEGVIRPKRNFLKKPVFLAGNADWVSELPFNFKQSNETIHSSTRMTPTQSSKK